MHTYICQWPPQKVHSASKGGMAAGRVSPHFLLQDELLAELEELEQEELDKNLLDISGPETVPLPNVPSVALPSKPGEYSHSWDTPWHHEKGVISWSVDFGLGFEPKRMCCDDHDASVICRTDFLTSALLTWPDNSGACSGAVL